ncbi:tyrosine-protein phosphatase [Acidobacteriota bacterium]
MIDLHTHILPSLDDGARDLKEALAMARMAVRDGITAAVATPHFFRDGVETFQGDLIRRKRDEFQAALHRERIPLTVHLGAEVHVSHDLLSKVLKYKGYLMLNRSSYLFIEFPSDHIFRGVKNLIFELMTEGVRPIITHPERNSVFQRNPGLLFELVETGVLIQMNSGSLTGAYGSQVRKTALDFLRCKMVHFLASDCHSTKGLIPNLSEALLIIREQYGDAPSKSLVEDNPQAVLDNGEIPYQPDPRNPVEAERSFKIRLPSIFGSK